MFLSPVSFLKREFRVFQESDDVICSSSLVSSEHVSQAQVMFE